MSNPHRSLCLTFLLLLVSFSFVVSSNVEERHASLDEFNSSSKVLLPMKYLNQPGFQEGSVFSNGTLGVGSDNTCGILDNGSVVCWGRGNYGALGNGANDDSWTPTPALSMGVGRTAVSISSGQHHTCAIIDNGSVSCWGLGDNGQLGNGDLLNRNVPTPVSSLGVGRTAVAISSGAFHTCVILDNGSVSCWGWGQAGQLGNGVGYNMLVPTPTSSLGQDRTAIAISSGGSHTCIVLDNGAVSCWGANSFGQLGNGEGNTEREPVLTDSLGVGRTAVAIAVGLDFSCALLDDGTVSCWGNAEYGQLGDSHSQEQFSPQPTKDFGEGRRAVSLAGKGLQACVILDDGNIKCWGYNANGQLGNGGNSNTATPTLTNSLGGGRTAIAISAGTGTMCALLSDGNASCWGTGYSGRLGNGQNTNKNVPTQVSDLAPERTYALSERDWDDDGVMNIFDTSRGEPGSPLFRCPPGTYTVIPEPEDASDCKEADPGHYVDLARGNAQESQTPCPEGTFNPANGSTSPDDCRVADAGNYLDASLGPGQATQIPCPAGTFNANTGATSVVSCFQSDAGYYVEASKGTGQTEQSLCPDGTYNPSNGSTSNTDCMLAESGHFVNVSSGDAPTAQTPCANGSFNPNSGSFAETDCQPAHRGHYVDVLSGQGQSQQTTCPEGTYSPFIGATSLSDCQVIGELPLTYISESSISCDVNKVDSNGSFDDFTFNHSDGTSHAMYEDLMDGKMSVVILFYASWDSHSTRYLETNVLQDLANEYSSEVSVVFWQGDGLSSYEGEVFNAANTESHTDTFGIDGYPVIRAYNPAGGFIDIQDQNMRFQADGTPFFDVEGMATDLAVWSLLSQVDADGDGVPDTCDAFSSDEFEWRDSDLDGVGDNADELPFDGNETLDSDGDGVGDNADLFPNDANETLDADGDGMGDNSDPWPLDPDSDWDGWADLIEEECETDPLDRNSTPSDLNENDVCDSFEGYDPHSEDGSDGETNALSNFINTLQGFASPTGVIAILIVGVLVVFGIGKLKSEDDDWDEEFDDDFHGEFEDHENGEEFEMDEPELPLRQPSFVRTWQELPPGEWLENDENGTNWYQTDDGVYWYSTDVGFRIWEE
jgi:alpha-tubulin suppressor-like RCC1 family protein